MSIKTDILWRVGLIYLAIALFAIFIIVKIIFLQWIDVAEWKKKAENTRVQNFKITPHRGDIYSSDMRLLASSVPSYEVRIDMQAPALTDDVFYSGVDSLSLCLSRLFRDCNSAEYKRRLSQARKKGNRYFLVKNRVNYIQLKELQTFPIFRRGRFKGGLIIVQENIRKRIHQNLAARTIGYVTKSNSGNIVGIEGAFDKYLAGVEGVKRMQKITGNVWMPVDGTGEIEPKDGSSVVSTIDIDLQDVAEKALLKQLTLHKAHHGTVIVMEVATGEINAIVNLVDTFGAYREYYNYAIGESTEPGSTFKLPALIAALEDGFVDLNDSINTGNGIFEYYDYTIRDDNYKKGGYGKISVRQVFELSSNVGMAKIITGAYKSSPHRFIDRLYSMNLNNPLRIEIKGEGMPMIKYPGDKYWSGVTLAAMSYGYEVSMTPLQILSLYNAVANDGRMVCPKFVREIRNHGKIEKSFETRVINPSICSRSTLKKVRSLLEGVVENGTAKNLRADYLKIAGKTGTTQIFNKKYGYKMGSKVSYQASFVGYFPADKPKYSCIVVINSPTSDVYHGNSVAGPVFLEIANKVYASNINMQDPINFAEKKSADIPFSKNGYMPEIVAVLNQLDIKEKVKVPDALWVSTLKHDSYIELVPRKVIKNLVPDVTTMGLKDAIYLLESMGLNVEVVGRGSVRNQSIAPGTRINKGAKIVLEMSFTEG